MFDIIHEIAQTLSRNKMRTFLTGISVGWGIFMLIMLLGAAKGVLNAFDYNMRVQNNMETIVLWGGITLHPYAGYEPGRHITLQATDAKQIEETDSRHIDRVEPFLQENSTNKIEASGTYATAVINGVYPGVSEVERINLTNGRFINDRDITDTRKVIVVEQRLATQLFGNSANALGKTVSIGSIAYTVVGVYAHRWRSNAYIPFTTLKTLKGAADDVNQLTVVTKDLKTETETGALADGIVSTLARLHNFSPVGENGGGVWIWNRYDQYLQAQKGFGIMTTAVWVVGLLTLLSGIVGISNIMFVSVKERTHEIGIRRAIGAKPRSILTNIVSESIAITALFGYLGIVAGLAGTALLDHLTQSTEFMRAPGISITMAIEVTIVLVMAGAIAGLFPAIKATKIKPVEALRDE